MSRGQRPRTPAEFPRMKDRAAGRHLRRAVSAAVVPVVPVVPPGIGHLFRDLSLAVRRVEETVKAVVDGFAGFPQPRRSDYALLSAEPKSSLTRVGAVIDVVDIGPSSLERQKAMREKWLLRFPSTAQWPVDGPR